ncbi:hypothetical protein CDL12_27875 [Handroanthus impetiginosus]|uniref:Uncharacterized protein n=1 Tax=Handroanthus impetiginosus TaxID=429701 RepID=A0A2G9G3Z7_9LAMI|nr:hypothetical protein CDL12_27875 [Handroanthus impetiginosus]
MPTSTRKGLTHICKKCLQAGHNKTTCKNPIHPRSKLFQGNPSGSQGRDEQLNMSHGSSAPPPSQTDTNLNISKGPQNNQIDGVGTGKVYEGRRNDILLGIKRPRTSSRGENSQSSVATSSGGEIQKAPRIKKPTVTEVIQKDEIWY